MLRELLERRLIGEILIERRLITLEQLDHALAAQKASSSGKFIGEVLTDLGYVSEIDIVTALILQCHLPYISISRHIIDPQVLQLIPGDVARKDRLIPFERIGNVLSVAMLNPANDKVRQQLETISGCCIATFISTRSEIDGAIHRFYPQEH